MRTGPHILNWMLYAAMFWLALWAACEARGATLRDYLAAVCMVESNGRETMGDRWDVNGVARGPMQIHRAYAADAGVPWSQCYTRYGSERAVVAYAKRHEPEALRRGDWSALARLQNGGPNWRHYPSTRQYADRVMRAMKGH